MNINNYKYLGYFLLFLAIFYGFEVINANNAYAAEEGKRKIVVFDESFTNKDLQGELFAKHGVFKIKDLNVINGATVIIPSVAVEKSLKSKIEIKNIENDVEVSMLVRKDRDYFLENMFRVNRRGSIQPTQALPWGVDHIDADLVWPTGNNGEGVNIAVIDTGISKDHPDIKDNIKGGYNAIDSNKSWNDDNGHGSHVAGIISSSNNSIGAVGVAPLSNLYAVKALNRNGNGFISDIIDAIGWSIDNNINIINMSFGSSSDSPALHTALTTAYNSGIILVAAAGNSGGSVLYPAIYPEVIAVSAIGQNDTIASFSSRGEDVDFTAPGVDIYSTYKGSGYATLSGTSMASPHIAGAMALILLSSVGVYDVNLNEKWDSSEVVKKLQDTAIDLGESGFDVLYGYGLPNIYTAIISN